MHHLLFLFLFSLNSNINALPFTLSTRTSFFVNSGIISNYHPSMIAFEARMRCTVVVETISSKYEPHHNRRLRHPSLMISVQTPVFFFFFSIDEEDCFMFVTGTYCFCLSLSCLSRNEDKIEESGFTTNNQQQSRSGTGKRMVLYCRRMEATIFRLSSSFRFHNNHPP